MVYSKGDLVGVPCSIQLGPFPDEHLVTVETEDGFISGFVKDENLRVSESDSEHGFVKGMVVRDIDDDRVEVRIYGSFFTTASGLASVRPNGLTKLAA